MATATTSYVVVKRDPNGRVVADAYASSSPAEAAQRASLSGIGDWVSAWQTIAWKKSVADSFWADPMTVVQGAEDPDAPYGFDVYVMRKVVTVVDDDDVRSTETRYESLTV